MSYVTCELTPGGALIETVENVVPLSPPFACKRVNCVPTIKGPPLSVTPKCPLSAAGPSTMTLSAMLGVTVDNIVAVGLNVRLPLIEMIGSGVSVPWFVTR